MQTYGPNTSPFILILAVSMKDNVNPSDLNGCLGVHGWITLSEVQQQVLHVNHYGCWVKG